MWKQWSKSSRSFADGGITINSKSPRVSRRQIKEMALEDGNVGEHFRYGNQSRRAALASDELIVCQMTFEHRFRAHDVHAEVSAIILWLLVDTRI